MCSTSEGGYPGEGRAGPQPCCGHRASTAPETCRWAARPSGAASGPRGGSAGPSRWFPGFLLGHRPVKAKLGAGAHWTPRAHPVASRCPSSGRSAGGSRSSGPCIHSCKLNSTPSEKLSARLWASIIRAAAGTSTSPVSMAIECLESSDEARKTHFKKALRATGCGTNQHPPGWWAGVGRAGSAGGQGGAGPLRRLLDTAPPPGVTRGQCLGTTTGRKGQPGAFAVVPGQ